MNSSLLCLTLIEVQMSWTHAKPGLEEVAKAAGVRKMQDLCLTSMMVAPDIASNDTMVPHQQFQVVFDILEFCWKACQSKFVFAVNHQLVNIQT